MPDCIFTSYSPRDSQQANAVCTALEAAETTCWIAPRDVIEGENWAHQIVDAVNCSDLVVLLLSAGSNDSQDVCREINRACSRKLRILTVRIENVMPTGDLEYYLSNAQWLDAFEGPIESHLEALLEVVRTPPAVSPTLSGAPVTPVVDEQVVASIVREIDRLLELEQQKQKLRYASLDNVLDSTTDLTKPLHAAAWWDDCLSIYDRVGRLDGHRPCVAQRAW